VRRALLAALLAAAALPAGASAAEPLTVSMPGKFFDPARITTVSGDPITFRNADLVTHDVRIAGGAFDSGPLGRAARWTTVVDAPGEYPFICTLHAFMSGNLTVVAATLSASPDGVLAGQPLTLSGRAGAGTAALGLERAGADGIWTALPDVITPDADGTYRTRTPAVEGASYRVTTPLGPSPAVTPKVTASIDLHVMLRKRTLSAHAMPAPAGMVATLQVYDRWHYRWRGRHTVALDAHGGASFRVPRGSRTYARVVLRRRKGEALVASRVLRTSDGHEVPDPDTLTLPAPHGGDGGHGGHGGH
jgi:plastocyanin